MEFLDGGYTVARVRRANWLTRVGDGPDVWMPRDRVYGEM